MIYCKRKTRKSIIFLLNLKMLYKNAGPMSEADKNNEFYCDVITRRRKNYGIS